MSWIKSIEEWRALTPEQQREICRRRLPGKVARSMAFEGEPVDQEVLEAELDRNYESKRALMMKGGTMGFKQKFEHLTGHLPMKWQTRLYRDYFAKGDLPTSLDVPTGLGKTSVIAIWFIALTSGACLPRRLVYVVDRRAVVDQATTVAESIKEHSGECDLRISTLRGQHADNRAWLEDPGKPAIIVGTVDMIGSRLLFSGYGVSKKSRSYHAGLLGVDSLIVLDESHLVPPFERLLESIEAGAPCYGPRAEDDRRVIPRFRLLSLSATAQDHRGKQFRLDENQGDLDSDDIVNQRLHARKRIRIESCAEAKLEDALAEQAWKLCDNGQQSARVLVYCNSREIARKTEQAITKLAEAAKMPIATELFIGARRVRERMLAAERLSELGFLASTDTKLGRPAFVISTAAGEVGVDMDADHMVCDLVAWERMVQRFGRVNRMGIGSAQIILVTEPPKLSAAEKEATGKRSRDEKLSDKEQHAINQYDAKCVILKSRLAPFDALPIDTSSMDASPGAIRNVKLRSESEDGLRRILESASTPPPLYPALNRALVDAWSMTSLERHTGRPEVGPWLRGWVEDAPQTEVVWRRYLPVRIGGVAATTREIEDYFEAAPPHLSERLATETWRVGAWLADRTTALLKQDRSCADCIVAFVLNVDGSLRESLHAHALVRIEDKRQEKSRMKKLEERTLSGATLIVDQRLGGLRHIGLLGQEADACGLRTADDGGDWPVDVGFRVVMSDAIDADHQPTRVTCIFPTRKSSEGEDVAQLLVQTTKTEDSRAASFHPQRLAEHQSWAEDRARKLGAVMGLMAEHVEALAIAARLHDEGKRARRWQRAFNAPADGEPYAKTRGPLVLARLGGYRHEFGSLHHAEQDMAFQQLPEQLRDLVLHLIAAHHGRARPIIGIDGCEDAPPSALETRARDVALRFARLQNQWGPWGLAWWEALLRAADQQASHDNDNRRNDHG